MKCPKCGFVSFEYLVECKGCSIELKSHKDEYEIDMDQPQMLPILAYYNKQNDSKKEQVEADISRLHNEQEAEVADEEFADLEALPLEEETVSLGNLTTEEEEKEVDLSATEVPDLEDIQLHEKVEDVDLSALSDDQETVDLELGEETTKEKSEEISLDLDEGLPEEPAQEEEEVLSLSDLTGEEVEEEEISLDLGLDLEETPQEEDVEDIPLDQITLEDPVEELEIGEVTLEELEAPAPTEEDVEDIDLSAIEEVEDVSLSLSLDEEEEKPQKAEPTPHQGEEEEVVTLDDLLVESTDEGDETSLGVEEFDLKGFETEEPAKVEEKAPEVAAPQFETGDIELSLEDNGDAAQRSAELKKKEQEHKSFEDLDIDLNLELE